MVKADKYNLDKNIKPVLLQHFEQARKQANFGNGRYVRSLFEKLKFEQADRITSEENADINLIKLCDVQTVIARLEKYQPKQVRRIGF